MKVWQVGRKSAVIGFRQAVVLYLTRGADEDLGRTAVNTPKMARPMSTTAALRRYFSAHAGECLTPCRP